MGSCKQLWIYLFKSVCCIDDDHLVALTQKYQIYCVQLNNPKQNKTKLCLDESSRHYSQHFIPIF